MLASCGPPSLDTVHADIHTTAYCRWLVPHSGSGLGSPPIAEQRCAVRQLLSSVNHLPPAAANVHHGLKASTLNYYVLPTRSAGITRLRRCISILLPAPEPTRYCSMRGWTRSADLTAGDHLPAQSNEAPAATRRNTPAAALALEIARSSSTYGEGPITWGAVSAQLWYKRPCKIVSRLTAPSFRRSLERHRCRARSAPTRAQASSHCREGGRSPSNHLLDGQAVPQQPVSTPSPRHALGGGLILPCSRLRSHLAPAPRRVRLNANVQDRAQPPDPNILSTTLTPAAQGTPALPCPAAHTHTNRLHPGCTCTGGVLGLRIG
jgi:hypothetical protein